MRVNGLRSLCIGFVVGIGSNGVSVADDGSWNATYEVSYGKSSIGELHREVKTGQGRYEFSSRLVPKGLGRLFSGEVIEEMSSGRVEENGGWRPENYFYSNSSKPNKPRDFLFDWEAMVVSFADTSLDLVAGAQDELSQMRLLAQRLAAGDQEVTLQVFNASKRQLYEYRYRRVGEEELSVPLPTGAVRENTVVVTLNTSRDKYATRFWLAPERNYLPLRIERTNIDKQYVVVMQLVDGE